MGEDLAEGVVEETNELAKEGGRAAFHAAKETQKEIQRAKEFLSDKADDCMEKTEQAFQSASEEIDRVGDTAEGTYNRVTKPAGTGASSAVAAVTSGASSHSAIASAVGKSAPRPTQALSTLTTAAIPPPRPP